MICGKNIEQNIVLPVDDRRVRELLLTGKFGLEKEALRVTKDGRMSHTPHRFVDDPRISRDFGENQTEINTHAFDRLEDAYEELRVYGTRIRQTIAQDEELLWPFSNPPYLEGEDDIPIAQFAGDAHRKTKYREYLAKKYGRYVMTFSGVHFNFSFSDELIRTIFSTENPEEVRECTDRLYFTLAGRTAMYGWIMVAVCAASPVMDSSFMGGTPGEVVDSGYASVRCSDEGYWNDFPVVLDYSSAVKYAGSINRYIDEGRIIAPSELYYPIRIKSAGEYSLEELVRTGADHIELRMIDLNPFVSEGVDLRDMKFAHLLLVWLACCDIRVPGDEEQLGASSNFKEAAKYDIDRARVTMPGGRRLSVRRAALEIIEQMKSFYDMTGIAGDEIPEILQYEERKLIDDRNRYACRVRSEFAVDYVIRGLELAAKY